MSAVTGPFTPETRHIAVVSGGLGESSQTRMLAERLAEAASSALAGRGSAPEIHLITLRELAVDVAQAQVTATTSPALRAALDEVEQADAVIAVSPTFKASYAGLFKAFWDLVDDDAVRGTTVLLGATGGTARHSLMIDTAMRPLFSYLRTRIIPTAVFAASDDWGEVTGAAASMRDHPLNARIAAAGRDLAEVMLLRPVRPRRAKGEAELEVTPFDQLLNPGA
ncbi:CE1759 family FMN reductase [Micrococcus sp. NPDC078436]|uniref:CE1759 family FMN reductase n=1 Tax=Micrococcus sp. NPDC078436 TaxID=3154960 RepID=UPI00344FD902